MVKISDEVEQRLERIEGDIYLIKKMLTELLSLQKQQQTGNSEVIMNVKEVSAFLGLETSVIYNKCSKGELPCFRVGKLYKFRRSELLQWMERKGEASERDVDNYVNRYLQKNILRG